MAGNRYRRAAASGGFAVPNIPNILLWFDPSYSPSVTTSGSNITRINDRLGGSNYLTADVGKEPTISSLNSLVTPAFNGSSQGMYTNDVVAVNNPSYVYVLKMNAVPAGNHDLIVGNGSPYYENYLATDVIHTFAGADNNHVSTLDTNSHVVSVVFSGSNVKVYIDGVATTTGTNFSTASLGQRISFAYYKPAGINYSAMNLGEVIIVNGAIADSDRVRAQNYLKTKWGTP